MLLWVSHKHNLLASVDHIDHLERCGLAWPSPAMFNNLVHTPVLLNGSPSASSEYGHSAGHRAYDNSSPARYMPAPPPPTPSSTLASLYQQYTNDDVSCYDMPSSRDSSYSFVRGGNPNQTLMQASRLPDLSNDLLELARHTKGQARTTSSTFTPVNLQADQSKEMLPPPLPSHVFLPKPDARSIAQAAIDQFNPRLPSRESDVSMHTSCDAFPGCTSEDQYGRVYHKSPTSPATAIRSKKSVKMETVSE